MPCQKDLHQFIITLIPWSIRQTKNKFLIPILLPKLEPTMEGHFMSHLCYKLSNILKKEIPTIINDTTLKNVKIMTAFCCEIIEIFYQCVFTSFCPSKIAPQKLGIAILIISIFHYFWHFIQTENGTPYKFC